MRSKRRGGSAVVLALVAGTVLLAFAPIAGAASCPGAVDDAVFAGQAQLRKLVEQENSFGARILGSSAHNKTLDWIKDEPFRRGTFEAVAMTISHVRSAALAAPPFQPGI